MKNILIVLISLLSISQTFCQESETIILEEFFNLYKTSPSKAVDYVYSTNKWIDGKGDAVKQLKSQIKQYEDLIGEYYGEEFLVKGELGESFATHVYLVKYERQPFRFTFEFYKANDKWIVFSFKLDDNFDEDLESVLKFEYIQNKE